MTHGRVIVMNKAQAEQLESRPYTAVISIFTPGDPPPILGPFWPMTLSLAFHDVVPEKGDPEVYEGTIQPMTMAQAVQIVGFIDMARMYDFMVHCDAGMSRSMAVGEYIHRVYGHKLDIRTIGTPKFLNLHVSRLLERANEARFG